MRIKKYLKYINHYEKIYFPVKWLHVLHNHKAQSPEVRFLTCSYCVLTHYLHTFFQYLQTVAWFTCNIYVVQHLIIKFCSSKALGQWFQLIINIISQQQRWILNITKYGQYWYPSSYILPLSTSLALHLSIYGSLKFSKLLFTCYSARTNNIFIYGHFFISIHHSSTIHLARNLYNYSLFPANLRFTDFLSS